MKYKFTLPIDILNGFEDLTKYSSDVLPYHHKPSDPVDELLTKIEMNFSAENIRNILFPKIEGNDYPHIFISHSSGDQKLATQFANFMYKEYGITSFIDSMLWGHIDPISEELVVRYAPSPVKNTYDLKESMYILSHMHLILNQALMQAMDEADSFIFIESDKSLVHYQNNQRSYSEMSTFSPWISSEIEMANKLSSKQHKNRPRAPKYSPESASPLKKMQLEHELNMDEFIQINELMDKNCIALLENKKSFDALDIFYKFWSGGEQAFSLLNQSHS